MKNNLTTAKLQNWLPLHLAGVDRGSVQNVTTDHTQNPEIDDTPDLDQDPTQDLEKTTEDQNDFKTNYDPAMEHSGSVQ